MKYLLILCLVIVSLFTTIASKRGHHSGPRDRRVVGGYDARPRSHPYLVSIQYTILWYRSHLCTGSILNERWILTAAHSIKDLWLADLLTMIAVVGNNDNKNTDSTAQIMTISKSVLHPKYTKEMGPYNIAMLQTEKSIKFGNAVSPIEIALPMLSTHQPQNLILAGWGADSTDLFYQQWPANMLQEARVEYIPFEECQKDIKKTKPYADNPVDRSANICTGSITGKVLACLGDVGAPLIQYVKIEDTVEDLINENTASAVTDSKDGKFVDNTRTRERKHKRGRRTKKVYADEDIVQKYKDEGLIPVLIGVVSWTMFPCVYGVPTVYTNVSMYADFIIKHYNS